MTFSNKTCRILFLLVGLSIFPTIQCDQNSWWKKIVDSISTSHPMYWLEKNITAWHFKDIVSELGTQPASAHYQELGKEAQSALGIPTEYQVPIEQLQKESNAYAIALPQVIYINEEKLNKPYGVQRCILFHEATHKKYNDNTTKKLIIVNTFLGTMCGASKIIKACLSRSKPNRIIEAGIVGFIVAMTIDVGYECYTERRADIEGFSATDCATCVQEMRTFKTPTANTAVHSPRNNSYLVSDEIKLIEQSLHKQNKICAYHQNHQ